ncbi:hypothetical protein [Gemmata sp.]|uniref:hypothetical protein n=1 Tax=Gemmata sp. TaxID=1914242 RepID=UPI003F721A8A
MPTGPVTYVLTAFLRPDEMRLLEERSSLHYGLLWGAFRDLITESDPEIDVAIKALVELPTEGTGLNNCFFKTEQTITHDELRFRSKGEVAIYDELKRRSILFFPNPAAVLGNEVTPELVEKREPDFLVCSKGKWGILEVNGEPFHSGPVSTAKDHERFRLFQRHGLFFVQAYDADRCKREPARVVNDFLRLLEEYR